MTLVTGSKSPISYVKGQFGCVSINSSIGHDAPNQDYERDQDSNGERGTIIAGERLREKLEETPMAKVTYVLTLELPPGNIA